MVGDFVSFLMLLAHQITSKFITFHTSYCIVLVSISYYHSKILQHPSGFLRTQKNTDSPFTSQRFRHLRCQAGHYRCKAYGTAQHPADAIVIGGGLAGMSASMALLDRGGSVVMVEKHHSGTVGKVGGGYQGGDGLLVCVRI